MARVFITGSSDGLGLMAGRRPRRLHRSDDPAATVTGGSFYHQRPQETHPAARDVSVQDELLGYCARLAGVELPP